MKILKIEKDDSVGDSIRVLIEGYPHALPVFPVDITTEELKTKLAEWKINQDEVDALNEAAKEAPKPILIDISNLKVLEGKEI